MNKARKTNNKKGNLKRLVNESFVLSSTRFVSSRLVRFFEAGKASPLLKSVNTVDRFCKDRLLNPVLKKLELRKNFTVSLRNHFASFFVNNSFLSRLNGLCRNMMNASLRSAGIFLLTFGIYSAAIFLLKRYISSSLGQADINDLCVAAITVIVGLLLMFFGDKSIISALGSGKITGALLSNSLGVNDSTLERASKIPPKTSVGISFLLGSLLGVLTLFINPFEVLMLILGLAVFAAILNVPEFGLLLSVASISFAPLGFVSATVFATVISYGLKWLRLKRNLRFGSADVAVLLFTIVMFIAMLATNQQVNGGEFSLLCFFMMYFAAKNLICSAKLLYQSFGALCNGLCLGMIFHLMGCFAHLIPHEHLRNAAVSLSSNCLKPDMLAMLAAVVLPFALAFCCGVKSSCLFVLLSVVCAVVSDSSLSVVLLLSSVFVFVAFAFKAPAGAALSAVLITPAAIAIISKITFSSSVKAFAETSLDPVLENTLNDSNFWAGLNDLGGPVACVLMIFALILILQRIFGCTVNKSSKMMFVSGTVAASVVMSLAGSVIFNPFSDIRTVLGMFFLLGLCGSAYKVCSALRSGNEEV